MIRTILVPLDGSPLAEQALSEACRLARDERAAVVLVQVILASSPHDDVFAREAVVREADRYLQAMQERIAAGGIPVRTDIFADDPAEAIALAALVYGADIIVMSTHGRSGLGRVLLGSVAERVLRDVDIPVLLVRAGSAPATAGPYHGVLIPLDGTPGAEEALRYVASQAVFRAAQVVLVHSVPAEAQPVGPGRWGYVSQRAFARAQDEACRQNEMIQAYLDDLAGQWPGGHRPRTYVTAGDPREAIVEIARAEKVDLIAVATHARHGLDDLIHGSVARNVIQHAPVPVLVLCRPDTVAVPGEEEHVAAVMASQAS